MSVAFAIPHQLEFVVSREDRSMGAEGSTLRQFLTAARAPALDRGAEIVTSVTKATRDAEEREGLRVSAAVFVRAVNFLNAISQDVPLPTVEVESDNEIGLDWDEGYRSVISVTVNDTSMVGYSTLFGREPSYGRLDFGDTASELPQTLRFFLARLYPRRRAA